MYRDIEERSIGKRGLSVLALDCRGSMNPDLFLRLVAKEAGAIARNYFREYKSLHHEQKGSPQDLVTAADREVERFIVQALQAEFPADSILGEESGWHSGSGAIWVVDPIDGTANFVRGIGYYCISIAYIVQNEVGFSTIYDPMLDELFYAEKGQGAYLNDTKITAGSDSWECAVIGLGRSERYAPEKYWDNIPKILGSGAEYRRLGSAALSLAHVAAGRLSAYYEPHLYPWDALGGLLLAQESGAVTNIAAYMRGDCRKGAAVLAASPSIYEKLHKVISNNL